MDHTQPQTESSGTKKPKNQTKSKKLKKNNAWKGFQRRFSQLRQSIHIPRRFSKINQNLTPEKTSPERTSSNDKILHFSQAVDMIDKYIKEKLSKDETGGENQCSTTNGPSSTQISVEDPSMLFVL